MREERITPLTWTRDGYLLSDILWESGDGRFEITWWLRDNDTGDTTNHRFLADAKTEAAQQTQRG